MSRFLKITALLLIFITGLCWADAVLALTYYLPLVLNNKKSGFSIYLPLVFQDYPCPNFSIMAIGDSITWGIDSNPLFPSPPECRNYAYPLYIKNYLEAGFHRNYTVINRGGEGLWTNDLKKNIGPLIDTDQPDLVLIMSGTNDHDECDPFNVPFAVVDSNLRQAVWTAQSKGVKVVIATNPPVCSKDRDRSCQMANITAFLPYIYAIGRDFGIPVADVWGSFSNYGNWCADLISNIHGQHPNSAGQMRIRDVFLGDILPNLDRYGCYVIP